METIFWNLLTTYKNTKDRTIYKSAKMNDNEAYSIFSNYVRGDDGHKDFII